MILSIVILLVGLLYYFTPNVKKPKFRWISVGATIAIVTWILASAAFGFYVANFSSYNKTYGSLAGVVVFLLWIWLTNLAPCSSAPRSTPSSNVPASCKPVSKRRRRSRCHRETPERRRSANASGRNSSKKAAASARKPTTAATRGRPASRRLEAHLGLRRREDTRIHRHENPSAHHGAVTAPHVLTRCPCLGPFWWGQ